MWQRSEECACLGWLEDKSWPRDMEELPLGVSLAKAVADNGGESVLRKRLVAWNNADIWWERGARETVEGWRVKKKKNGEWTCLPLCFSRGMPLYFSVILARQIIHWGKSRSTRRTRRYDEHDRTGVVVVDEEEARLGRGWCFLLVQRWSLRIFLWYRDVCWEEGVFNREAWEGKWRIRRGLVSNWDTRWIFKFWNWYVMGK